MAEGGKFTRDVANAGGAFKSMTEYLVAGYWAIYHNQTSIYSITLGETADWIINANPGAVRYVLTW